MSETKTIMIEYPVKQFERCAKCDVKKDFRIRLESFIDRFDFGISMDTNTDGKITFFIWDNPSDADLQNLKVRAEKILARWEKAWKNYEIKKDNI